MTSNARPPDAAPSFPATPWWRRLANRIWGYDFFVSYHWASGGTYAVQLAEALRERHFDCFLDRSEFAGGDDWKDQARQALNNTQGLILIGTHEALTISQPVRDEVTIFSSRSERIIPVLFGERIEDSERDQYPTLNLIWNQIVEIIETAESLTQGPSEAALDQIEHAHKILRRRKLRAILVTSTIAVLAATAVAATLSFFNAERQRLIAQRALAETQRELAQSLIDRGVQELETGDRIGLLRLHRAYELAERIGFSGGADIPPDADMSRSARRLLAGWIETIGMGLLHDEEIFSAVLSPDGALVRTETVNIDGEPTGFQFWDATSGRPLVRVPTDDSAPDLVMAPDWSSALHWNGSKLRKWSLPSGDRVELVPPADESDDRWDRPAPYHTRDGRYAAVPEGERVTIWDLSTGQVAGQLNPGFDNPKRFGFSDDGTVLALVSGDRLKLAFHDIRSAEAIGPEINMPSPILELTLSPGGQAAVVALENEELRVMHAASGRLSDSLGPLASHFETAFSANGEVVLVTSDNRAFVVSPSQNTRPAEIVHEQAIIATSVSHDGRTVATLAPMTEGRTPRNEIWIWDVEMAQKTFEFSVLKAQNQSLVHSQSGDALLVADTLGFVAYGTQNGHRLGSAETEGRTCSLSNFDDCRHSVFSPDGASVLRLSREGARVERLTQFRLPEPVLDHPEGTSSARLSAQGERVLTSSKDGVVQVWDIATLKPSASGIETGRQLYGPRFSPDGMWVVTEAGQAWNAETGAPLSLYGATGGNEEILLSQDGTFVSVGENGGQLLDNEGGILETGIFPYSHDYEEIVVSGNRRYVASYGYGTEVVLHDLDEDDEVGIFDPRRPGVGDFHEAESVDVILFSPNETRLLASTNFGTLRIWDIESKEMVMELTGPDANIATAAFSPDGEVLATLSSDGVAIWDVNSNARTDSFKTWQADSLAFTSDGQELLVAGREATVRWIRAAIGEQPERLAEEVAIGSLAIWNAQELPASMSLGALNSAWDRLDALDMP